MKPLVIFLNLCYNIGIEIQFLKQKYNLILKKSLPFVDSSRLELIYYTNNANSLKENGDLFESAINYNKALDLIQKDDSTTIFTLINNFTSLILKYIPYLA